MTIYYNRIGECNRCGQCCGAIGTGQPDRRSPFPKNWPWALRGMPQEQLDTIHPHLSLMGIDRFLDQNQNGTVNLQGKKFYWVAIKDIGIVADSSPQYNGSAYEPQCPFLEDDPGDGTRPCGLVGTRGEPAFTIWCADEPTHPRSEELVQEWQWRYPDCSYTWEQIP